MGEIGARGDPGASRGGDAVGLRSGLLESEGPYVDTSLSLQSAASVFCLTALTAFLLPLRELPSYYHNYNLYTFH